MSAVINMPPNVSLHKVFYIMQEDNLYCGKSVALNLFLHDTQL